MSHCSFCRLAARPVFFEGENVSVCPDCALAVARRVVKLSDQSVRELWQLPQRAADDGAARSVPSIDLQQTLASFRENVAETVPESDAANHFELAIAYDEMGLFDEAVAEFEVARRSIAPERLGELDAQRFPLRAVCNCDLGWRSVASTSAMLLFFHESPRHDAPVKRARLASQA